MTGSPTRVAHRYLMRKAETDALQMPRRKVVDLVNGVIDKARLRGFFDDEYWRPVNRIWDLFHKAGIPFSISESRYEHEVVDGERVPMRKIWQFEVPFTSERGRPGIVYGRVVAAGAGSVKEPLDKYDVTAYVS